MTFRAKNKLVHCSKTATLFNRFAGGGLDAEPGIAWVLRALHLSVARDFYLHSSMKLEWRASTIQAVHPPIGNSTWKTDP